jgi:hypothetical protein
MILNANWASHELFGCLNSGVRRRRYVRISNSEGRIPNIIQLFGCKENARFNSAYVIKNEWGKGTGSSLGEDYGPDLQARHRTIGGDLVMTAVIN